MATKTITVSAENGIHARPASEFVKTVKTLAPAEVTLKANGKTVKGNSIISILSLGLKKGTELEVCVNGGDENAALEALCGILENA